MRPDKQTARAILRSRNDTMADDSQTIVLEHREGIPSSDHFKIAYLQTVSGIFTYAHSSVFAAGNSLLFSRTMQPIPLRKSHLLLDLGNGQCRVQALGACPAAVQNCVASVQTHAVVQGVLALCSLLITRVCNPSVRLHEHGWSKVLFTVPPV